MFSSLIWSHTPGFKVDTNFPGRKHCKSPNFPVSARSFTFLHNKIRTSETVTSLSNLPHCATVLTLSVSSKASPDFTLVTKFFPNNPWQSGRKAVHSGDRCWGHGLTSTETSPWLKETTQHIVNKTQDTGKCSQSKTLTSLYIRLGYACILRCIMMCTHTCFIHVSTITSEGLFCHRILGCPPCPV